MVPFAAIRTVPIAALAWYRLQCYTWYRYSDISNYVTKQMAADFYEVDIRTIENCLADNEDELKHNGYRLWKGNALKDFKLHFAPEKDFGTKTTQLGLFDFRSFLNVGMLLTTMWLQGILIVTC